MTRNHSTPEPPVTEAACARAQRELDDRSTQFWCERCGERSRYVEMIDGAAFHPMCRQSSAIGLYPNDPSVARHANLAEFMRARNVVVTETRADVERRRLNAEFALHQFHSRPGVRAINEALGPSFVGGFEARVFEMFNLSRAS